MQGLFQHTSWSCTMSLLCSSICVLATLYYAWILRCHLCLLQLATWRWVDCLVYWDCEVSVWVWCHSVFDTSLVPGEYQTLQAGNPDSLLVVSGSNTGIPQDARTGWWWLIRCVGRGSGDADDGSCQIRRFTIKLHVPVGFGVEAGTALTESLLDMQGIQLLHAATTDWHSWVSESDGAALGTPRTAGSGQSLLGRYWCAAAGPVPNGFSHQSLTVPVLICEFMARGLFQTVQEVMMLQLKCWAILDAQSMCISVLLQTAHFFVTQKCIGRVALCQPNSGQADFLLLLSLVCSLILMVNSAEIGYNDGDW